MSKIQVNFRLPDSLIAALRERAEAEGKTTTEVAVSLLEAGLGLPATSTQDPRIASIEDRIAKELAYIQVQLDQRIEGRISSHLASHLAPLHKQVIELTQCVANQTAAQTELLQAELSQVKQRIENRIQAAIQNFGCEPQVLPATNDNLLVESEAAGEPAEKLAAVVEARAPVEPNDKAQGTPQYPTRKELGELLGGVTHEAIRLQEESGKLAKNGWHLVCCTIKPRLYYSMPNEKYLSLYA